MSDVLEWILVFDAVVLMVRDSSSKSLVCMLVIPFRWTFFSPGHQSYYYNYIGFENWVALGKYHRVIIWRVAVLA
jgi:hypothetical protein